MHVSFHKIGRTKWIYEEIDLLQTIVTQSNSKCNAKIFYVLSVFVAELHEISRLRKIFFVVVKRVEISTHGYGFRHHMFVNGEDVGLRSRRQLPPWGCWVQLVTSSAGRQCRHEDSDSLIGLAHSGFRYGC